MFNPFITQSSAQLTLQTTSGDAISVEISMKDIPKTLLQSAETLTGELTARRTDGSYILTLKDGTEIPVKISPAMPLGTKFVAQLDAQGKPISGQFMPPQQPKTPVITGTQTQNQATQTPLPSTTSQGQAHPVLQTISGQQWISLQATSSQNTPLQTQIPLTLLPQPAQLTILTQILQNARTLDILTLPQGQQQAEAPSSQQGLIVRQDNLPFARPIPLSFSTPPTAQVPPLQMLSLTLKPEARTTLQNTQPSTATPRSIEVQVTQKAPFNPTVAPLVPENTSTPLTSVEKQTLARSIVLQNTPESLPAKAPVSFQIVTPARMPEISELAKTLQPEKSFTQQAILPSGQVITVKTPLPLAVGQSFTYTPAIPETQNPPHITSPATGFTSLPAHANAKLPITVIDTVGQAGIVARTQSGDMLLLKSDQPLPIGMQAILTRTEAGNIQLSHVHPQVIPTSAQEVIPQLSNTWSALKNAISQLSNTPQTHNNMRTVLQATPELRQTFMVTAPLFLNAVMDKVTEKWLGNETTQVLKALGVDLGGDLSKLSYVMQKTDAPDAWRGFIFPYHENGENLKQGGFYWKDETVGEENRKQTRFIMDIHFSQLGDIQMSGLFTPPHLTLKLSHTQKWDSEIENALEKQIHHILSDVSYSGSVHISQQPHFEKQHLEALDLDNSQINLIV